MARVSNLVSRDLGEYLVVPGEVRCAPEEVNLEAKIGNISLRYPLMTARMQSVVGPEMAVTAGRSGILTCVPRSLHDQDKQAILDANNKARLEKGDIAFHDKFEYCPPNATYGDLKQIAQSSGFSVIPVVDRFSHVRGFYIHNPNNLPTLEEGAPAKLVIQPVFSKENPSGVRYAKSEEEAIVLLNQEQNKPLGKNFAPVIDEQGILRSLSFRQNYPTNAIGLAISTRDGWEKELEKWGSQVDTLMIDSSNAWFKDAFKILQEGKKIFPNKPFGVGNVVTAEAYTEFAKAGADYIIAGMGVGSICQTGHKRNNGRGQFTVGLELAKARDEFRERYVPLVLDGGISTVADMTVALALADIMMCGGYFNQFREAAGPKYDLEGNLTSDPNKAVEIASWGEGHPRARQVGRYGMDSLYGRPIKDTQGNDQTHQRYGHKTLAGATVEGVVGKIPIRGHLRPGVQDDMQYVRTTIANSGATNLEEYRELAHLELASDRVRKKMEPQI